MGLVKILPGFWHSRLEVNASQAIFHQWQQLEASGCIQNFRIAAGQAAGWREGWFFADSDAYKWLDAAARIFVGDCIGCGSCSWVCPSYIPLVQYFNYANGELADQARQKRKNERVKTLSEAHTVRMELIEKARKEARAGKTAPKPNEVEA